MGVYYSKIGGLTKVYHSLTVIVGVLIIAGGTYGSWVSLVAFFAFTGIEVVRYSFSRYIYILNCIKLKI